MSLNQPDREKSLKAILTKLQDVKVLPQVVYQVMESTEGAEASPLDVEKKIAIDPGFTAKILTIANSAHYALPKQVTSIREAVMLLGFLAIREVAMKASVFDFFVGKSDNESVRRRDWWKSSVDSANICRELATTCKGIDSNQAYTAGLLHLLGRTLLDQSNPQMYDKVNFVVEKGADIRQAERAVYGIDHVEVIQAVAQLWSFPAILVGSLNYFDAPEPKDAWRNLRSVLNLANSIAKVARQAEGEPEVSILEQCPWACEILELDEETLERLVERAKGLLNPKRAAA